MVRIGWKVPLMGSWALAMSNFIDNAGPNAEGTRMPQTFIQDGNTPAQGLHRQVPQGLRRGADSGGARRRPGL
jgi:hypothetical protein